jgi:flagellin
MSTAILAGATDFLNGRASAMMNLINHADMVSATAATATTAFQNLITSASSYVTALGTQRGLLGAYQNQIEYTVSNVTELSSNLSAARSRVTDTDYAAETAALTKGQILQQASTAMLAQANQMPNVILTLLK